MSSETMNAIAVSRFTDPSGYELQCLPRPSIRNDDDVIIKIHTAGVNPYDMKKANGVTKQVLKERFPYIIGYDGAGVVIEVGASVKKLKVGDEVYTCLPEIHRGSWAEYARSTEKYIDLKPKNMSFNEAASLPVAAITALQALNQYAGSLEGKTVFIPAGLGGTGAYACQLAKNIFHAGKVITTVSTSKVPKIPQLLGDGVVDQVIDYTKENPLKVIHPQSVDFAFDTMGQAMDLVPLMKKDSFIVSISTMPSGTLLQTAPAMKGEHTSASVPLPVRLFLDAIDGYKRWKASRSGVTYMYLLLEPNIKDLHLITQWVEEGKVKPVVGTVVQLNDMKKMITALNVVFKGKGGIGKTVIEVV